MIYEREFEFNRHGKCFLHSSSYFAVADEGGITHSQHGSPQRFPGMRKNGLAQQTLVALHVNLRPTCAVAHISSARDQ